MTSLGFWVHSRQVTSLSAIYLLRYMVYPPSRYQNLRNYQSQPTSYASLKGLCVAIPLALVTLVGGSRGLDGGKIPQLIKTLELINLYMWHLCIHLNVYYSNDAHYF